MCCLCLAKGSANFTLLRFKTMIKKRVNCIV